MYSGLVPNTSVDASASPPISGMIVACFIEKNPQLLFY